MKLFLSAVTPIAATAGLVILATTACCDLAVAADLPLVTKARPLKPVDASQFWAGMDYLAWSVKGDRLPPLVTTSPAGTPLAQAGILGPPTTTVLFGDSSVNGGWRSGGRLSAGYWFDPQHTSGIEASFFGLEQASTGFNASSASTPILARPFFNAITNAQDAQLIAFPGVLSGSVSASETSRLYGAGALYRREIGSLGWRAFQPAGRLSLPALLRSVGHRQYVHHPDRRRNSSRHNLRVNQLVPCQQQFSRARSRRRRRVYARPLDARMAGQGSARRQLQ